MVDMFYAKYFYREETVMLATLQGTKLKNSEDLMEYIKRFRDIAFDCYDHCEEKTLVEMCLGNMIMEYRVVLENIEISQSAQLLQKARKTTQSVRPSFDKPKERRSIPQAIIVSTSEKKRKSEGREYENPPPIPYMPKELDVFLNKWIADGVFKPNQVSSERTEEEWRDLHFYRLHHYVQHATAECWAHCRLVHCRIREGTLELFQLEVHRNPFPNHKGKGVIVVIICTDLGEDEDERLALPAAAMTTLQKSLLFKNLFN